MLTTEQVDALNRMGRALADPTRCRILVAMLGGPVYPAKLAETLGLTRSNVSNHLTCLRGCGLVTATPQGRQVRYELAEPELTHALADLLDVVLKVEPGHDHDGHLGRAADATARIAAHEPAPEPGATAPRRPGLAHDRAPTARPVDRH